MSKSIPPKNGRTKTATEAGAKKFEDMKYKNDTSMAFRIFHNNFTFPKITQASCQSKRIYRPVRVCIASYLKKERCAVSGSTSGDVSISQKIQYS